MVGLGELEKKCTCGRFPDDELGKLSQKVFCTFVAIVPFGIACGILAIIMGFVQPTVECGPYGGDPENAVRKNALGKWYDAPREMELAYVCKQATGTCPESWEQFEGSCYKLMCDWKNFIDAEKSCESEDAQLVSIHSADENKFVQKLVGGLSVWIGLSEPPGSEEWRWHDGADLGMPDRNGNWNGYSNWHVGEPNNFGGRDEDKGFMNYWEHVGLENQWPERQRARYHGGGVLKFQMIIWCILAVSIPLLVLLCAWNALKPGDMSTTRVLSRDAICCLCSCGGVSIGWFVVDILIHVLALFTFPDLIHESVLVPVIVGCMTVAICQMALCTCMMWRSQQLTTKILAVQSFQQVQVQAQSLATVVGMPVATDAATSESKPVTGAVQN